VTPRWADTWAHSAAWVAEPRATFKIVVGDDPDLDQALRLIGEHRLPRERVMLMPEGLTDAAVRQHALALVEACRREGFRLSPRLHIWLWGARRGV
jgi:7-carboxy-7-deazaguanine synthase